MEISFKDFSILIILKDMDLIINYQIIKLSMEFGSKLFLLNQFDINIYFIS